MLTSEVMIQKARELMAIKKIRTVRAKQMIVFLAMISLMILFFCVIFFQMQQFAISRIYAQMQSHADYHINSFEYRMEEIMRQQAEFFTGRQLSFLADERILDDYDRREALLSVQEKLGSLKSIDIMLKEVTLYIPNSKRVITPERFLELDEERQKELDEVISELDILCVKEGDLSYSRAEVPYVESYKPNFYVKIVLDKEQIISLLNDFALQEGGVCWYNPELEWYVEDTAGIGLGRYVLERVGKEEGIQKIDIDGTSYLVNITQSDYFGMLIQYCSQKTILKDMEQYKCLFLVFLALTIAGTILFSVYMERLVHRPLKKLYVAFEKLQQGNMAVRINHTAQDEFSYIYERFNHAIQDLEDMIEKVYIQEQMVARAELKQLQSQINPHFLYNTFFLFNGRIDRGDFDGAKALAEYLGEYFLYLTRSGSDTLRLEDELSHAENYARIQECRFNSRISLIWESLPEEARNIQVPRLIIQPILENAYKYGLENMEEDGILHVYYRYEGDFLKICLENSGDVAEEVIQGIQESLTDTYAGEVTGLINIHRRLINVFGKGSGITVEKGELGGVLAIIYLPFSKSG